MTRFHQTENIILTFLKMGIRFWLFQISDLTIYFGVWFVDIVSFFRKSLDRLPINTNTKALLCIKRKKLEHTNINLYLYIIYSSWRIEGLKVKICFKEN